MAVIKFDVKFPCGLELKSTLKGMCVQGSVNIERDLGLFVCPMHGKQCAAIPYLGKKK